MKWTFIPRWRKSLIAVACDTCMIPLAWSGACLLTSTRALNLSLIFLLLIIQASANIYCGLYRGIWRFASIPDLVRILRSVIVGTCTLAILFSFNGEIKILFSVYVIYALLLAAGLCGSRILFRCLRDYRQFFTKAQRVLIVGAGNAGEGIARDLLRLPQKKYQAVGFIDDSEDKQGCDIHGIRVVGRCKDIKQIVKQLQVELILIAIPSANSHDMRRMISECEKTNIPFRTLPGLKDIASGVVSLNALREVLLDDLLGREQVMLDWKRIQDEIVSKNILVTGGGGSIGSELCKQIVLQSPNNLIVVDNNEFNLYKIEMDLKEINVKKINIFYYLCSVTDKVGMQAIFDKHQPQIVFHSAAYKHVPLLEKQLRFAMRNNILGTRIVAEMAKQANVEKFILISTDKAVNPVNIMGATKRAAEILCQNMNFQSNTKFMTVRFGNVLNSAGSVLPLFRKQIQEGGPITVTHPEMTRYFMTIPEAAQLILQASAMGLGGEIYVLDMGQPINIRYLAEQLIKLSGKIGEQIQIKYIGLRPGEKLHEELFHSEESLTETAHRKISQAKVRRCEWTHLLNILDEIELATEKNDEVNLAKLLFKLVPEYKPEHETFQQKKNEVSLEESLNYV